MSDKVMVDEASAVFFKTASGFIPLLSGGIGSGTEDIISRVSKESRFWPDRPGLYVVRFMSVDGGEWSFAGGARPSVYELAQIYDGTWTGLP